MAPNFRLSAWTMASPLWSLLLRSSNGLSPMNTVPAFGLLTKPLIESPGKATVDCTPGWLLAIAESRLITACVRSSDAASGSCAYATTYCLSCVGTKPGGTFLKPTSVIAMSPAYTASATALFPMSRRTALPYLLEPLLNARLNGWNTQPNSFSRIRVNRSGGAPCGLSRMADNAGDSVSELNAEMSVENAIVSAN